MSESRPANFTETAFDLQPAGEPLRLSGWTSYPPGAQPDVIWLHANGFNGRTYLHTLGPLASELAIFSIDQRGHGRTPQGRPAEHKTDALDMRDDLLALLDKVASDRPVILAGHSMGGCVALLAAAETPARVRGLALFDPVILSRATAQRAMDTAGWAASESPLVAKARTRRRRFASREEAFDGYRSRSIFATWPAEALRDYVEAGFREVGDGAVELSCAPEWEAANFAAHGHDIWEAMSRVEAPVRIYRAEKGSTCAIVEAEEFPRPPGQAQVATVPGSTHFLPIENPAVVREALLSLDAATR